MKAKPQPRIALEAVALIPKPDRKLHQLNTFRAHPRHKATLLVTADTGCMSSMTGLKTIDKLGLSRKSILPVTTQMRSADGSNITLLGATFIELSGKSPSGGVITTKQMVYITPDTEAFYLSRKGCEDLGLISNRFPTIGDHPKHRGIFDIPPAIKKPGRRISRMWLSKTNPTTTNHIATLSTNR